MVHDEFLINSLKQLSYGNAGIAQLVEQLICNQQVVGSNPTAGSFQLRICSVFGAHKAILDFSETTSLQNHKRVCWCQESLFVADGHSGARSGNNH